MVKKKHVQFNTQLNMFDLPQYPTRYLIFHVCHAVFESTK